MKVYICVYIFFFCCDIELWRVYFIFQIPQSYIGGWVSRARRFWFSSWCACSVVLYILLCIYIYMYAYDLRCVWVCILYKLRVNTQFECKNWAASRAQTYVVDSLARASPPVNSQRNKKFYRIIYYEYKTKFWNNLFLYLHKQ